MKRYLKTIEEVIQALKDGKTVEDKDYKYRLVSGIICSVDKEEEQKGCSNWIVGETIFKWAKPYVMEPEVLKLEVGKWYETRDHQKARCFKVNPGLCFFTIDNVGNFNTLTNGNYYIQGKTSNIDIIGPWEE